MGLWGWKIIPIPPRTHGDPHGDHHTHGSPDNTASIAISVNQRSGVCQSVRTSVCLFHIFLSLVRLRPISSAGHGQRTFLLFCPRAVYLIVTMTSTRCSLLMLQCLLWLYEHFGFKGLHVDNGGELDRSFHLMEGSVPIRTSGLVR